MQEQLFKTKVSEAEILKSILVFLKLKRIFHWRQNSGSYANDNRWISFGFKGCSDIIAIFPSGDKRGTMLTLEVKRPGGSLSDSQIEFILNVRKHGGCASVVESVEDVEKVLADPLWLPERYRKACYPGG